MVATRLSRAALTVTVVISMLIGWSREGKLNLMNDEEVEKFEGGVVISSVSPARVELKWKYGEGR